MRNYSTTLKNTTNMPRKTFYSFHYIPDSWRVSKIRNIGALEDNKPASDNDWETIKGDNAKIERWIANQLYGRSCTIVLIGANTAGRKWITYEINESWKKGIGVLGIHVHNITDSNGNTSSKGSNPFSGYHRWCIAGVCCSGSQPNGYNWESRTTAIILHNLESIEAASKFATSTNTIMPRLIFYSFHSRTRQLARFTGAQYGHRKGQPAGDRK